MDPDDLYAMFTEELGSEGFERDPWEDLPPREQIAWGKLARRIEREQTPAQGMLNAYPD